MESCPMSRRANWTPSKRTFDDTDIASLYQLAEQSPYHVAGIRSSISPDNSSYHPLKRRSISYPGHSSMHEQHDLIMSDSFPSFTTVYGTEESSVYSPIDIDPDTKTTQHVLPLSPQAYPQQHLRPVPVVHRNSIHSVFTESAGSSPTTTEDSTFDSPIVSDTSSYSPESATDSMIPPSPFAKNTMSQEIRSYDTNAVSEQLQHTINTSSTPANDVTKNVKKLTLDMAPVTSKSMSVVGSSHLPALLSPSKESIKSARKKPTNLSIRTPGYNQMTFLRSPALPSLIPPPTPGHRPMLHQYPSSPALSTLTGPRTQPNGEPTPSLPRLSIHNRQTSLDSNRKSFTLTTTNLPNLREDDDQIQHPKSGEAPEKGYIDGPIQIYDSGVYLYLEPTAYEASGFDTVINVAKEVKNPFKEQEAGSETVVSALRENKAANRFPVAEPQTAVSEFSFRTANEWPSPDNQATPTATTPTQKIYQQKPAEPEYLHVAWDHNSEILEDLYPLCQLIDDRTQEGKKVLIHCQLGVSRSASLIIAYGLFKGYQPDFHSMYMSVKDRSRWVGPNMSLIYQLTDFKSRINRGQYLRDAKELDPAWFSRPEDVQRIANSAPASAVMNAEVASLLPISTPIASDTPQRKPSSSRKPTPLRLDKELPPTPAASTDTTPQALSNIYDKPLPRPTDVPTLAQTSPLSQPTSVKRAASRPLPFRQRDLTPTQPQSISGRPTNCFLPETSYQQHQQPHMDLAARDVPDVPSMFSPRATEFSATPWGITGAGDLATAMPSRYSREVAPTGFAWLQSALAAVRDRPAHYRTASKDPRAPLQEDEEGRFSNLADHL